MNEKLSRCLCSQAVEALIDLIDGLLTMAAVTRALKVETKKTSAAPRDEHSPKGDLTRYREKRDFAITPEPAGEKASGDVAQLRFVIQKHAARRLHYDLRLELDGVYKSWAVTRGPSFDPHEKRLAVHVEDHPIDYGDFEGIIPAGEYGGGTVMIWDRGTWLPEYDPDFGYRKGHLAFNFEGEKLKGKWHLVRTKPKPNDKKEQWLLFKADDEFAKPGSDGAILEEAPDSVATGRTMDEIAHEKDAVWSSHGSGLVKGDLSPQVDTLPTSKANGRQTMTAKAHRHPRESGDSSRSVVKTKIERESVMDPRLRGDDTDGSLQTPSAKAKGKKGSIPLDFIPPCLALLAEAPPPGEDWLHEIKFDGYRLMILIQDGRVKVLTRSGLDWTHRFPAIAEGFANLSVASAIVDCEGVILDENGVSSFSALQDALSDGRTAKSAIAYAFDLLHLDGEDMRRETLDVRKAALGPLIAKLATPSIRYSDHIVSDGDAMAQHACRLGLEGIISKRRDAAYRSGRHGEWLKIKCTNRSEFVVGGYVPSTAARSAIGSLALGYYDGGKLVYAGRTGTGFTQRSAQAIYATLQPLKQSKSPFASALTADEKRGVIFAEPNLVAEVEFRGWTGDKHLRHAAFKGLREDKSPIDVVLETAAQGETPCPASVPTLETKDEVSPAKQSSGKPSAKISETAARKAKGKLTAVIDGAETEPSKDKATSRARAMDTMYEGVKLTHPDRILWKDQGLTKLGLAEYYADVADHILPHIANRPLALIRCPSGSEGQCFFQKHAFAGLTDAVQVTPIADKDGTEETLVIHNLRGLISLVQANVLEIHPWGSSIASVEKPDRLIFDLDPGDGVTWEDVIAAAKEVRDRLSDAGLRSFVKTSGGKGLHIVANIEPGHDWETAKAFTHRVAIAMETDSPAKFLSTMSKKARTGKIFVDYLRNGRGATAISAFSTRARPGAPVSTPVAWEELSSALSPARYTVDNMHKRLAALKSRNPWEGFFEEPGRLMLKSSNAFEKR